MTRANPMIDSHVHLDLMVQNHPRQPIWLRERQCTVVSWAFGLKIKTVVDLRRYLDGLPEVIQTIGRETGLGAYFLVGIHPRNIPDDLRIAQVPGMLAPLMEDSLCLGVGEIGLERGSVQEIDVFQSQLELVRSLNRPALRVGVHTPRNNKKIVTEQILQVLEPYHDLHHAVVVDHCNAETLPLVLERGYWAGVTLSPPKTSLDQLEAMIASCPDAVQRVMCNTDSGTECYDDLVSSAACHRFSDETAAAVFGENAARFFGLSQACPA